MAILRCENCGAMVKPGEGKFTATCEYCGTEMTVFESTAEFEIDSKGVLVQYNGKGGDVIVPEAVRVIGKECFCGNERIFTVQLPDSVTEIQESAFEGCTEMEEINLPNGLETLANHVFFKCSSLKEITVPDGVFSLKKSVFCECVSLSSVKLGTGIRTIGDWVFGDCAKLEYIELPPNVKSLGQSCFRRCSSLKKVNVNNKLQSISDFAFSECVNLEEFICPKNLIKIEDDTFRECFSLKKIEFNYNLQSIGGYAFAHCIKLEELLCPKNLIEIKGYAFWECSSLKKIEFNDGLEYIGIFAFSQCTSLTGKLSFPPSLIRLDITAFDIGSTYSNITSITIGGRMKTIDVCLRTPNVESVHFNEGVENIVRFFDSETKGKIQKICFPQTLRTIGDFAFRNCESLKEVTLPDSLTSIGEDAFYESGLRRVIVPEKLRHKFINYDYCQVVTTSQEQQQQIQLLDCEKELNALEKKLDTLKNTKKHIEWQRNKLYETLSQYQEEFKALGIFDRSRKKEYATEIEKLNLQKSDLNSEYDKINSDISKTEREIAIKKGERYLQSLHK